MTKYLFAGTGRVDITPAPGTPQGGWGAQTHQRGTASDMPLYATTIVLSESTLDPRENIAIVDVDSIGFDEEWTARIIDAIASLTRIQPDHIRLSCTHTHSGPNTFRLNNIGEGLDMAVSYLESLPLCVAGAVWKAQQSLQPVRMAVGTGECNIGLNRRLRSPNGHIVIGRNWQGITDPTVGVLRLDTLDEQPLATLVHFACHPTTMGWQNQLFTPDYPGQCRRTVEDQLGGTCIFLQGAAGNLTPVRGFTSDTRIYRHLGKLLGLEAARVALTLEPLPRQERLVGVLESGTTIALYEDVPMEPPTPRLHIVSRSVPLPLKNIEDPEPLERDANELRDKLDAIRASGTPEEVSAVTAQLTQADMRTTLARLYYGQTTKNWQMQCICIGNLALISMRGEPFAEIGLAIKAASRANFTFVSGYSNGVFSYIPTCEAYLDGGYEVEAGTPFLPGAADLIIKYAVDMLSETEFPTTSPSP